MAVDDHDGIGVANMRNANDDIQKSKKPTDGWYSPSVANNSKNKIEP